MPSAASAAPLELRDVAPAPSDWPEKCPPLRLPQRVPRGFTLVEVLVALMIVALSLAALMTAVSGAARASGYLRDKTVAQWIALNRIAEVRLKQSQKFGENKDKGEVEFANRRWRYDTRYFDTDTASLRRVVVRVWPADAKDKAPALAESASFLSNAMMPVGSSVTVEWLGDTTAAPPPAAPGSRSTAPLR